MNRIHDHPPLASLFDPTRRTIFERVARRAATVDDLVEELDLSPLEVTRHIRNLIDVGLLRAEGAGERSRYRLDCGGMASMDRALDAAWSRSLARQLAAT